MDIGTTEQIARLLYSQLGVFAMFIIIAISGYYGVWRWNREYLDLKDKYAEVEEDRNYWRETAEKLQAQIDKRVEAIEADNRRLIDMKIRGIPG